MTLFDLNEAPSSPGCAFSPLSMASDSSDLSSPNSPASPLSTNEFNFSPTADLTQTKKIRSRSSKKCSYKHVPHSLKPPHLVAKRNARERRRVEAVNSAFTKLRKHVPFAPRNKRLSKVKTLKYAIDYIYHLKDMIQAHDVDMTTDVSPSKPQAQCVQNQNNLNHFHYHHHHQHHQVCDTPTSVVSEPNIIHPYSHEIPPFHANGQNVNQFPQENTQQSMRPFYNQPSLGNNMHLFGDPKADLHNQITNYSPMPFGNVPNFLKSSSNHSPTYSCRQQSSVYQSDQSSRDVHHSDGSHDLSFLSTTSSSPCATDTRDTLCEVKDELSIYSMSHWNMFLDSKDSEVNNTSPYSEKNYHWAHLTPSTGTSSRQLSYSPTMLPYNQVKDYTSSQVQCRRQSPTSSDCLVGQQDVPFLQLL